MLKRKKKAVKKAAKKPVSKKTTSMQYNRSAHWKAYKELQARADKAWAKFQKDMSSKAKSNVLAQDYQELLLVLGECEYMIRAYMLLNQK